MSIQSPFSQVSSSHTTCIQASSFTPNMYNKSSATATSVSHKPVFTSHEHVVNQYRSASSVITNQLSGQFKNRSNQALMTSGNETTRTVYQSDVCPCQGQKSASSSGNYLSIPDLTSAAAGHQRSVNSMNKAGNGSLVRQATTAQSAPTQVSVKLTDSISKLSMKNGQEISSVQYDAVETNSTLSTLIPSTGLLDSTASSTATISTTAVSKSSTSATSTYSKRWCSPLLKFA